MVRRYEALACKASEYAEHWPHKREDFLADADRYRAEASRILGEIND